MPKQSVNIYTLKNILHTISERYNPQYISRIHQMRDNILTYILFYVRCTNKQVIFYTKDLLKLRDVNCLKTVIYIIYYTLLLKHSMPTNHTRILLYCQF